LIASITRNGPSIKDVRRDGEGGFGQMRTVGRGVKDLADVRNLVLFFIVSECFADSLYGWCLFKYKLLFILYDLHHRV